MNKLTALTLMSALATLVSWPPATTAVNTSPSIVPALTKSLQKREQRLGSLRYRWQLRTLEQTPKKTPEEVLKEQNAIRSQVPDQLRKQGAKEDMIWAIVEQEVRHAAEAGQGPSRSSTHLWEILRADNGTLVTGATGAGSAQSEFAQYYSGRNGLLIHLHNGAQGLPRPLTEPPLIWGAGGDAIRYREPFQAGCNLWPEQLAFLGGFNPLAMHGANWSLVSTTARAYSLEARVKVGATSDPAITDTIRLTVSRRLGGAPARVNVTRRQGAQVLETLSVQGLNYRRRGADWVCDKLAVRDVVPGILTRQQDWSLVAVSPLRSLPPLPIGHEQVRDYRLVSLNMTTDDYLLALSTPGAKVVTYRWDGHFPSLSELAQLKKP